MTASSVYVVQFMVEDFETSQIVKNMDDCPIEDLRESGIIVGDITEKIEIFIWFK